MYGKSGPQLQQYDSRFMPLTTVVYFLSKVDDVTIDF